MISRSLLNEYLLACQQAHIPYLMGGKEHHLGTFPPTYPGIDCSGFARASVFYASQGEVVLPDGSVNELDWCTHLPFARASYEDCARPDNVLRIAFHRPTKDEPIGHVWLVLNRYTLESYGAKGPGSRSYDVPILGRVVSDVFVLPSEA